MAIAEPTVAPHVNLLNVEQMAQFVFDGFLEFSDLVPDDLNEMVHADLLKTVGADGLEPAYRWHITDNPHGFYEESSAVREVHALPSVQGVLQSLLGPGHVGSHSAVHATWPNQVEAQKWHVDGGGRRQVRLPKVHPYSFDILTAYFPHDTPYEMGPTLVLPGSHMRSVLGNDISRYKNIVGQKRLSGPGGRLVFMHEALWHCAQTNQTDQWRFMFKIRYNPRVPQRGLFDTDGWDNDAMRRFFRTNKGAHSLTGESPAVVTERANWWRYLCNAEELDDPSGTGGHGDHA